MNFPRKVTSSGHDLLKPCSVLKLPSDAAAKEFSGTLFEPQASIEVTPRCRYYLLSNDLLPSGHEVPLTLGFNMQPRYYLFIDTFSAESNVK
jgi:hypothetical protein